MKLRRERCVPDRRDRFGRRFGFRPMMPPARHLCEPLECRTLLSGGPEGDADPDDEIGEAFPVVVGGSFASTISTGTDVDMFSFAVSAGQTVAFDLDRSGGSLLDTILRIFNAAGTQVASNDDDNGPGEIATTPRESFVETTFASAGTYYLGVSAYPNSAYNPLTGAGDAAGTSTGTYTGFLYVFDKTDTLADALGTGVGISETGAISEPTDVDIYRFSATANQTVAFDLDRSGSALDSYVRLFNAAGDELAFNDDDNGPGETASPARESFFEYTFAAAGTYYVGVSGFDNSAYDPITGTGDFAGSAGAYELNLLVFDATDTIAESLGTAVGLVENGAITHFDDVDLYQFSAAAGQVIAFDLDLPAGSTLNPMMRLFNGAGTELEFNNDAQAQLEPDSDESFIEYRFASAATYYVGISPAPNLGYDPLTGTDFGSGASTGAYVLRLIAGDPNDQISEAAPTVLVAAARGAVGYGGDVDMYSFSVPAAGRTFGFDTDPLSAEFPDTAVRVFTAAGAQLASFDDSPAPDETSVTFGETYGEVTFPAAGTYYVAVTSVPNFTYNPLDGTGDSAIGSVGDYALIVTNRVATLSFAGALVINGTPNADTISFAPSGTLLRAIVNGSFNNYADVNITSVTINGLGLNDTINLNVTGDNPTTINGADGADMINVNPAAPAMTAAVDSGAGDDVVNVNADNAGAAAIIFPAAAEQLASLNIGAGGSAKTSGAGSGVLRTGALQLGAGAVLDLSDNAMIVDYAGSSPIGAIQSALTSGYAGGAWTGSGINSSRAAATAGTALGYAEATDLFTSFPASFVGQTIDDTAVLVRWTLYGDANLDRTVAIADFAALAATFNQTPRRWSQGNFNYDLITDIGDFSLLAGRFNQVLA